MSDTSEDPIGRAVPGGRIARAARLGSLATSVAGGAAWRGAQAAMRGDRPDARTLVLTPATARQMADALAQMRGAAMKVGQLISMEAGEFLPPEFAEILARLRSEADPMPPRQLKTVLAAAWGNDFVRRFRRFEVRPIAAASIGQVHRAELPDGTRLAVKVQYPGVRRSIDSDVDNVAALVRWSGILPEGAEIGPLLEEAKRQLHEEADYLQEARNLARFNDVLADDPDFRLPALQADLSTADVLAMEFVDSQPIERLTEAGQDDRDRAARLLLQLACREFFEFRLMQTDPNFANFRWEPSTGRIVLLDFGAVRAFDPATLEAYRSLLRAGLSRDRAGLYDAACTAGLLSRDLPDWYAARILDILDIGLSPVTGPQPFDFSTADIAARMQVAGMALASERTAPHMPPPDVLFLQRKAAGLYLLAAKLRARVDVRALFDRYL